MSKAHAQTGVGESESGGSVSDRSPAEVAHEREESRLYEGKAMDADSTTIMNHQATGNGSGESGSQGSTLGREDQNPITEETGEAASPGARDDPSTGGSTDER